MLPAGLFGREWLAEFFKNQPKDLILPSMPGSGVIVTAFTPTVAEPQLVPTTPAPADEDAAYGIQYYPLVS